MNCFSSIQYFSQNNIKIIQDIPLTSPIMDSLLVYADFSTNVILNSGNNTWKNLITNTSYGINRVVTYKNPGYQLGADVGSSTNVSPGSLNITFNNSVDTETLFFVINIPAYPTHNNTIYQHRAYLQSCNDQSHGDTNGRHFVLFKGGGVGNTSFTLATSENNDIYLQYSSPFTLNYNTKNLITITRSTNTSCPSSRVNGKTINSSFSRPRTIITNGTNNLANHIGVKNSGQAGATVYLSYILYEFEIYSSNLSLTDIKKMEKYLMKKWNIS